MKRSLLVIVFVFTGCIQEQKSDESPSGESPTGEVQGEASPLIVHEWGTFTSMYGSDGLVLEGLQHEEEKLPAFVYGRNTESPGAAPSGCVPDRDPCYCKCLEAGADGGILGGVTQKLETHLV